MTNVQDSDTLKQRQMQQRQILAMMGISQWVQPNSPMMNMADIALPEAILNQNGATETPTLNVEQVVAQSATNQSLLFQSQAPQSDSPVLSLNENTSSNDLESHQNKAQQSPVDCTDDTDTDPNRVVEKTYRIDTLSHVSQVVEPLVDSLTDNFGGQEGEDDQETVSPFNLEGGRYGNWVLLIDIQALTSDSQKLWKNVIQALSLSCETSSFPICAGMDTAELANASLAGYVFKLGRSEDIHVAALTPLPKGLHHPNIVSVPTLDEILGDASLKRILWEKVSS